MLKRGFPLDFFSGKNADAYHFDDVLGRRSLADDERRRLAPVLLNKWTTGSRGGLLGFRSTTG